MHNVRVARKSIYICNKKKQKPHGISTLCVFSVVHGLLLRTSIVVVEGPVGAMRNLVRAALPWSDLGNIHVVKLLQGAALTLDDEEEDHEDSHEETAGEDVSVSEVDLVGNLGCEVTDQEVPQPVGGSSQGHTLGTVLGWEKLGDDGPNHRAPGHGIGSDEETSDDNHTLSGLGSVLGGVDVEEEVANGRENHEHNEHPNGTKDEGLATAEVLNDVETTEGSTEVDSTKDTLSDETVGNSSTLEDGSSLGCLLA